MSYFPTVLDYTDSDSDDLPIVAGIDEAMANRFLTQLSDLSQGATNSTPVTEDAGIQKESQS